MRHVIPIATVITVAALLVGCTSSAPSPTPTGTSTPTPTTTPSETPEPTTTTTAAPVDPLAGTCDELLSPDQVASLFSPIAESRGNIYVPGGGGRASTEVDILALMPEPGRHCTWVVPDSEGGLIVSILRANAATRAAVAAETAEFFRTDAGPGVTYHTFESLDSFIFSETHALGDGATDYWVAVFTSGSNSREIAEIVWLDLVGT